MSSQPVLAERFLTLLKPLQRPLESYARRALFDGNNVEDAIQSALGNAFRDFERFEEGTNFRAWIFRYLNLDVLARNRKTASRAERTLRDETAQQVSWETSVVEKSFDELLESAEEILDQCDETLADAIGQLPENEQSVFLLRSIGEFHYAEIAGILGIPVGTVMSSLSRSRARLRKRLTKLAEERGIQGRTSPDDAPNEPDGANP